MVGRQQAHLPSEIAHRHDDDMAGEREQACNQQVALVGSPAAKQGTLRRSRRAPAEPHVPQVRGGHIVSGDCLDQLVIGSAIKSRSR